MVKELETRLEREGREFDDEQARLGGGVEGENEDEIPFSAKGRDGNANQVTQSAPTEQNSAERTGNVAESAGNDRPEFELETHTKNDLLKRSTIDDQDRGNANCSRRREKRSRRRIKRLCVDWQRSSQPPGKGNAL